MFKVAKGIAPIFMNDIFAKNGNILTENVSSNTRSKSSFYNPSKGASRKYVRSGGGGGWVGCVKSVLLRTGWLGW